MKMPAMIIVMLALMIGANFYVFWRLWHLMPPVAPARIAMLVVGIFCACSIFLYFGLMGGNAPQWLSTAIYRIGTSYLMIMLYVLIAFLLMDAVRLTKLVPMEWMKHGSWAALGIFAAVIAIIFVAGNVVYGNKKRTELEIAVKGLPATATPIKIVAVSDLHLGYGIGRAEFERWVDMINAEKPDLVVMAGDVIDTDLKPLYDQNMAEIFRRLKAPMGVFVAPGNHEYIAGADKSAAFFETTGVNFLRDSALSVGDMLHIVGRDDLTNGNRKPLAEILAPLDRSKPVLLLDHQPSALPEAEENGIALQISGHTHYGQVWPISWITRAIFENAYGYSRRGDTHYYVSSGLGIWGGKFRIGSRSEYLVVNLIPETAVSE